MAKFTPGAIISEIRNKIASTVYSRNRAGAIIRNRVTPVNRRTSLQTSQRQLLASFATAWRGLTAVQRAAWNALSTQQPVQDNLGQTIFLTGEQLYIRSNLNLTLIGVATISDAPVPATFPVLTLGAMVISTAVKTVAYTITPVPAGFSMAIRATPQVSAGKDFVPASSFRFIQAEAAAAVTPADLDAAYQLIFGDNITAGQKVTVEAFYVETSSGLAGQKVRATVVTT